MEIIAWRGASHKHLENSLTACVEAGKLEYDRIEIDTRLTSDGMLIAYHSPTYGSWGIPVKVSAVPWATASTYCKRYKGYDYFIPLVSDLLKVVKIPFLLHVKREVSTEAYYEALKQLPYPVDIHSNSERHLAFLAGHPKIERMFKSCYSPQDSVLGFVDGYMLGHRAFGDGTALIPEWLEQLEDKVKYVFAGNSQNWIDEVKTFNVDGLLTGRIDRT